MKITLFALNSSYTHTNPAVRALALSLSRHGESVNIAEYCLKDERLIVLYDLVSRDSDIYGFSAYIWNITELLEYAAELKKLRPGCHIIFGGPEVSFENEEFIKANPFVDTVICGEGEKTIIDICKSPDEYIGKVVKGEPYEGFTNEGILYDIYPATGDILYYESSRGCPYKCSYCLSSMSHGIRAKSVEKTLEDLLCFEKQEPRPKIIKFIDRTFNYDIERAKSIWRALTTEKYTLKYHFEVCADLLDDESIEILSKMPKGKIQIEAGIQSTNSETLEAINRKTDNKKAIDSLVRIRNHKNIHIHADLIAGLPYEDFDSFSKSFDDTVKCCDKLQLGFLKMLKGSKTRLSASEHQYVYLDKPPYTVLANNYISYEEMHTLNKIAAVIDRFYSSDSFAFTMQYVIEHSRSPFLFFKELTFSLPKPIKEMSQHHCRVHLAGFVRERFSEREIFERMALDALISENKNPPEELRSYYTEITDKQIVKSTSEKGHSSKIFKFDFAPGQYFIIDRTKHTYHIENGASD